LLEIKAILIESGHGKFVLETDLAAGVAPQLKPLASVKKRISVILIRTDPTFSKITSTKKSYCAIMKFIDKKSK